MARACGCLPLVGGGGSSATGGGGFGCSLDVCCIGRMLMDLQAPATQLRASIIPCLRTCFTGIHRELCGWIWAVGPHLLKLVMDSLISGRWVSATWISRCEAVWSWAISCWHIKLTGWSSSEGAAINLGRFSPARQPLL